MYVPAVGVHESPSVLPDDEHPAIAAANNTNASFIGPYCLVSTSTTVPPLPLLS